ncbi:MAG: late competence development ComFB family protein [Clostridia bacterium]|nr:late competence development ComFB family protein [Clostridia bacterium]
MHEMKNYAEVIVTQIADRLIPEYGVCRCNKCRLDIIAIALNQLPPRYVVTEKGALLASSDLLAMQKSTDYLSTVVAAIRLVDSAPRHDVAEQPDPVPETE